MADAFRIINRFHITGRGTVYTVKANKKVALRVDDILLDLHGNEFRVKGIEILRSLIEDIPIEERPIGIMLELMSGVAVQGNFLVRNLDDVNYLFCNHLLYPHRVNEDYEEEYQAAGLAHACALFSYEDFEAGNLFLYGEEISGLTIYRGQMMKPDMYQNFYECLEKMGIILINTPDEYEYYHLLPRWYEEFKGETAKSVWIVGTALKDILCISRGLQGSYVVRDYAGSRKHEWYDACFIQDIQNKNTLVKVIGNFIERQGTDLVGGVVLRKFENLKHIGFHEQSGMPLSEEYRVFVYAGRILAIDGYRMERAEVGFSDEEYQWVESIAFRIKSNFATVDLARKENGSLIIMELGDGQVSRFHRLKADEFYRKWKKEKKW